MDINANYRIFSTDIFDGTRDHVATVPGNLVEETLAHYRAVVAVNLDGDPILTYDAEKYDGFVQGQA